jgi:2-desacetyl-2-hydroxyethyl bacteriochlorophyllide A dehydrogenase
LAASFKKNRKLVVENVNIPKISEDEVLVEIAAAGICGSDVGYRKGDSFPSKIPIILGHEGAGIVRKIGRKVSNIKVDDHIVIHYVISCGYCKPCLEGFDNRCRNRISIGHDVDGTFAKYINVPARSIMKISDKIPFKIGAIAACAVSTAFHAISKSGLKKGDTAVIFGIGGVGLHVVMLAKFFGAGKIIAVDLVDSKLKKALLYGADIVLNPGNQDILEIVIDETDGYGADVSFECSGSYIAMEYALKVIKGKNLFESGTAVSIGLQKKAFQTEYWNLREGWLTVSGDHTRYDLYQIIKLIESGKIDLSNSVTHLIGLRNINEGMDLIERRKENVSKVVIDMLKN